MNEVEYITFVLNITLFVGAIIGVLLDELARYLAKRYHRKVTK